MNEPVELAVVIPTYNERENVGPLIEALDRVLGTTGREYIFVDDDSADGTADLLRAISQRDHRVRVLQRVGRRGLSSACLEGMMSTAAPYIAVMDADLQHDEAILPRMLSLLKERGLDVVVGSRNAPEGSMGEFAKERVQLSNLGRRISGMVTKVDLSDPMSGFFLVDRRFLEEVVHSASGLGFKILVDLLASATRPVKLGEVPYSFRKRLRGESKLDIRVGIEYLELILDKAVGSVIPPRFVTFSLVGLAGLVLSTLLLRLLLTLLHEDFTSAQALTALVAMTANFFLNNTLTWRERRLKGARLLLGLATFYAACSIGLIVNLRVARFAMDGGLAWYLAGAMGLVVGAVWNFGITSLVTWRRSRRMRPPGPVL